MPIRTADVLCLVAFLAPAAALGDGGATQELRDFERSATEARSHAERLAAEGQVAEAVGVLAAETERTGHLLVAEVLWRHYVASGLPEDAAKLVTRLLARRDEPAAVAAGHALAARAAAYSGDRAVAERHYRAYLASPQPRREVMAEYVAFAAPAEEEADRRAELAGELCREQSPYFVDQCSSDLLSTLGDHQQALAATARYAERWPESVFTLATMANQAEAARDWKTAEEAWRRVVHLEPGREMWWETFAEFYARRDSLADLEALAAEGRAALGRVPTRVVATLARVLVERQQPRRAIEVLREARADLGPEEETGWIDEALHAAYAALAREEP